MLGLQTCWRVWTLCGTAVLVVKHRVTNTQLFALRRSLAIEEPPNCLRKSANKEGYAYIGRPFYGAPTMFSKHAEHPPRSRLQRPPLLYVSNRALLVDRLPSERSEAPCC